MKLSLKGLRRSSSGKAQENSFSGVIGARITGVAYVGTHKGYKLDDPHQEVLSVVFNTNQGLFSKRINLTSSPSGNLYMLCEASGIDIEAEDLIEEMLGSKLILEIEKGLVTGFYPASDLNCAIPDDNGEYLKFHVDDPDKEALLKFPAETRRLYSGRVRPKGDSSNDK